MCLKCGMEERGSLAILVSAILVLSRGQTDRITEADIYSRDFRQRE